MPENQRWTAKWERLTFELDLRCSQNVMNTFWAFIEVHATQLIAVGKSDLQVQNLEPEFDEAKIIWVSRMA
jgi:hypothetical protein